MITFEMQKASSAPTGTFNAAYYCGRGKREHKALEEMASLRTQDLKKRPCGRRRGTQREGTGAGEGGSLSDRKSWAAEPWESHPHSHVHASLF